jgi:hypothetical protein
MSAEKKSSNPPLPAENKRFDRREDKGQTFQIGLWKNNMRRYLFQRRRTGQISIKTLIDSRSFIAR